MNEINNNDEMCKPDTHSIIPPSTGSTNSPSMYRPRGIVIVPLNVGVSKVLMNVEGIASGEVQAITVTLVEHGFECAKLLIAQLRMRRATGQWTHEQVTAGLMGRRDYVYALWLITVFRYAFLGSSSDT